MRKYTPQMLLYRHSLTAVSIRGGIGGGKGFPGGSEVKYPPAMPETQFDPWIGKIWRRAWQPTLVPS